MKIPEVTVEDYREWQKRYGLKCNLSDETLGEALSKANKHAQEVEDRREAARNKHLRQGNSVGREEVIPNEGISSKVSVGDRVPTPCVGSSPTPGNNLPVYSIKQPALIKED